MITGNFDPSLLPQLRPPKKYERSSTLIVPHHELIELLTSEIGKCKDGQNRYYSTGEVIVGLTADDTEMVAAIEVFPPDIRLADDERIWLGLAHSNIHRRATDLYGGIVSGGVSVCCEKYRLKKQRGVHFNPDAKFAVAEPLDNFIVQMGNFSNRVRELKRRYVSKPDADILMVEACRNGIFPWKRLGHVDKARQRLPGGDLEKTAWAIYSAFSWGVLHGCPPISQNPATDQCNRLFQLRHLVMGRMG